MKNDIDEIFDSFDKRSIFQDKSLLQTNYKPDEVLHRRDQIKQIASILAPLLRGERASNLFLYGKTGTGKTLSIQYVKEEILKRAKEVENFELKIKYLNCRLRKVSDTEYRILAELIKKMGGSVPDTGLPTQAVYSRFIDLINSKKQLVVLILDEIDQTTKSISDDFLYNLTRINSELTESRVCVVGISNDLTFLEQVDARVRSSLSEEEIIFSPYNASQLKDILYRRSKMAFKENVVDQGVIEKCAAYAAREHGDARRALDLLRVAGELAERNSSKKVSLKYIDEANKKIETDRVLEVIESEPKQFQVVLYSIIKLSENNGGQPFFTGDLYDCYQEVCKENKLDPLTQRRISDIIQELDMFGIINVKVISKGRGGRMREIRLAITKPILEKSKKIISNTLNYNS